MTKRTFTIALMGTVLAFFTIMGAGCAKKPKVPEVQEETAKALQPTSTSTPTKSSDYKKKEKKVATRKKTPYKGEGFQPVSPRKSRTRERADVRFKDVHFNYDKHEIKREDKPKLQEMAAKLKKNSRLSVTIEGHCDERGTNTYNRALGEKRAGAVRDFLYSLGVTKSRMTTVSYGEEKPVCMESNESCWWKNRRGHSFASRGSN